MPNQSLGQRNLQAEAMDDPDLPRDEHELALRGLARLNRCSGVASAMYRRLRRLAMTREQQTLHLLDVASGSGDVPLRWAEWAQRDGWNLQLTLLDLRSVAIEEQQRRARAADLPVLSLQHDCLQSPLPTGFDVATCSLFMHHLENQQAVRLLQAMRRASNGSVIICDLERSYLNLALVSVASRLLSRSRVVHSDATLSIQGAFTMSEFQTISQQALGHPIKIQRLFPCRFVATIDEIASKQPMPSFA
jgi:2-polyprenyl-3-methyl-5-hydroxy-6-metoxy-1,4-benzoquinol methylase